MTKLRPGQFGFAAQEGAARYNTRYNAMEEQQL